MIGKPLKDAARKTLAGFMAVWLSGVVFLICCDIVNGRSMAAEICPLAKMSEHCDRSKSTADVVKRSGADTVECCAFLPALFDKNRKLERTEQPELVSSQPVTVRFTVPQPAVKSQAFDISTPYIPDRQYTFIKNCVFRI
jgi:hypothetical protein